METSEASPSASIGSSPPFNPSRSMAVDCGCRRPACHRSPSIRLGSRRRRSSRTSASRCPPPMPEIEAAAWFSELTGEPCRLVAMVGECGWRLPDDLDVFGQNAPFSDAAPDPPDGAAVARLAARTGRRGVRHGPVPTEPRGRAVPNRGRRTPGRRFGSARPRCDVWFPGRDARSRRSIRSRRSVTASRRRCFADTVGAPKHQRCRRDFAASWRATACSASGARSDPRTPRSESETRSR